MLNISDEIKNQYPNTNFDVIKRMYECGIAHLILKNSLHKNSKLDKPNVKYALAFKNNKINHNWLLSIIVDNKYTEYEIDMECKYMDDELFPLITNAFEDNLISNIQASISRYNENELVKI